MVHSRRRVSIDLLINIIVIWSAEMLYTPIVRFQRNALVLHVSLWIFYVIANKKK